MPSWFLKCQYKFAFPLQQWRNASLTPHSLQHKLPSKFLLLTLLTGIRWNLCVVLICISRMVKDAEHCLKCLSAIWSFKSCLFSPIPHALWDYLFFWCQGSLVLCMFWRSIFCSVSGWWKSFSHFLGCKFVLLTMSFAIQNLLSFTR